MLYLVTEYARQGEIFGKSRKKITPVDYYVVFFVFLYV